MHTSVLTKQCYATGDTVDVLEIYPAVSWEFINYDQLQQITGNMDDYGGHANLMCTCVDYTFLMHVFIMNATQRGQPPPPLAYF